LKIFDREGIVFDLAQGILKPVSDILSAVERQFASARLGCQW
jgi:hypothetical protein